MGLIEKYGAFVTQRAMALEAAINNAKTQAKAGTYTLDAFFKDSLKLWVDGLDGWCGLFPYEEIGHIPILFGSVGSAATTYTGFVPVGSVPDPAPPNTGLIAVNAGVGSGVVTTTPQPDGTLEFDITSMTNLAAGDLYQCVCYYVDMTGKVHGVAVLMLLIS